MVIYIYAWEGMYQGLHGIADENIFEVEDDISEEELQKLIYDWGDEMSDGLIYQYGLEGEYLEELDDYDEDDYDIRECPSYCDRGWTAHKVKDEYAKDAGDYLNAGHEYFIEHYCEGDCLNE